MLIVIVQIYPQKTMLTIPTMSTVDQKMLRDRGQFQYSLAKHNG
jgi:hypothetical protein